MADKSDIPGDDIPDIPVSLLRSLLDNSSDVIYFYNIRTERYEYISPSAVNVVGYSAEELMAIDAASARAMIHPEDLPGFMEAISCLNRARHFISHWLRRKLIRPQR